ncbi:MAG: copper chaperone PCu(A)C [Actinobacteria bacterium]|nr:copper chaperone PCu(A)C [Actinomycetota bacterium]MBW3647727.1 copper chaperone PCu(A)C [Actinomycetota bacterium]
MTALRGRPTALAVAVLATASLSGCGAGLRPQTYESRTSPESSNLDLGPLSLRNVSVLPPEDGETYEVGDDAEVVLTVTNSSPEADRLVSVSSTAAEDVVVLDDGQPGRPEVPGSGSTGDRITLEIQGLREPVGPGEFVELTFRFEDNGTVEALVPIALTGESDRPIYTGEEGGEEEPALQAPTGGHSEKKPSE